MEAAEKAVAKEDALAKMRADAQQAKQEHQDNMDKVRHEKIQKEAE